MKEGPAGREPAGESKASVDSERGPDQPVERQSKPGAQKHQDHRPLTSNASEKSDDSKSEDHAVGAPELDRNSDQFESRIRENINSIVREDGIDADESARGKHGDDAVLVERWDDKKGLGESTFDSEREESNGKKKPAGTTEPAPATHDKHDDSEPQMSSNSVQSSQDSDQDDDLPLFQQKKYLELQEHE